MTVIPWAMPAATVVQAFSLSDHGAFKSYNTDEMPAVSSSQIRSL